MKVDYYETLGVERTCDDKELKSARVLREMRQAR